MMTESQYRNRKRKALGQCVGCGRNEREDDTLLCHKCRVRSKAAWQKKSRDKKDAHNAQTAESRRKKRLDAIASGMCSICFKEPADRGYKTCWQCRLKNRERNAKQRSLNPSKISSEKQKAYFKEYRQRKKQEKICIMCGKRPARDGRTLCGKCGAKARMHGKKYRLKKGSLPEELRGNGIYCYRCCKPKCSGQKLCPECYEGALKNAEKARTTLDTSDHIWRKYDRAEFMRIQYYAKKKQEETHA